MDISKFVDGTTLELVLKGRIDSVSAALLANEINQIHPLIKTLYIDVNDIEYISSAGLRVLLIAQKEMNRKRGNMSIKNVSDSIKALFDITGFSNILNITMASSFNISDLKDIKLKQIPAGFVWTLVGAIDAKDPYTAGHSERVADISVMIAKKLGKSPEEVQNVYFAALLHDVGKISIPDGILNKSGKLSDEEYEIIKTHPAKGAEILDTIYDLPDVSSVALSHHERFDGSGYPYGISGSTIPETASIVQIADAYDAMTSKRCYRDILSQDKVRTEIEKGSGKQFHPYFSEVMLNIISEDKDYNLHE